MQRLQFELPKKVAQRYSVEFDTDSTRFALGLSRVDEGSPVLSVRGPFISVSAGCFSRKPGALCSCTHIDPSLSPFSSGQVGLFFKTKLTRDRSGGGSFGDHLRVSGSGYHNHSGGFTLRID